MRILDGDTASMVLGHPRHQAAQKSLAELIQQLRECANIEDGHTLQLLQVGSASSRPTRPRGHADGFTARTMASASPAPLPRFATFRVLHTGGVDSVKQGYATRARRASSH